MAADTVQSNLQDELEKFKTVQKQYQKSVETRQKLDAQLNENNIVKSELDLLESDAKVYKMMGPALIQQDVVEAKQTVGKRIEYIEGEMKRQDGLIKDLDKKQNDHREKLAKLQQQFQKAQMQKS
ncbi:prefoldin subunit 6-like [Acanthaster planci]|uniref:Prefoldin subunit 6-like n=1 Tax=Acanthaster planci TaxID=133434 RepID=A0A8B7XX03_ACAPL|nr:prefoldin subunit 6-like [Acanthaster planci]